MGKVQISFRKVDAKARQHRQTAEIVGATRTPHIVERTIESLWYDRKPEGWNFLDWHRAWNGGNPSAEHIALYNLLHPNANEQIVVEDAE